MNTSIRILLVDDNPFFLEAARDFLELHTTMEVVGTATDGTTAVQEALELQPDLILLDLSLKSESAIPLIPVIKEALPQARIIVITIMESEGYRDFVLESGADAFVRKQTLTQTLLPSIEGLYGNDNRFTGSKS